MPTLSEFNVVIIIIIIIIIIINEKTKKLKDKREVVTYGPL